jgi:transmembrane sensor
VSAFDIEGRAADWLQRRHVWTWNAEDQKKLDDWLAEDLAHRVAYVRLEAAWARAETLADMRPVSRRVQRPARQSRFLRSMAATLLIAAAVGAATYIWSPASRDQTFATPVGGRETIILADESRIELNTDTVLRADLGLARRSVVLDKGEAFFQIKHNADRPFVVKAGAYRVTDIGTKFVVRRDGDRVEVTLVEGSARLDAPEGSGRKSATLVPGEIAVATANGLTVFKQPLHSLATELGWRRGMLIFKHTTLAEAADTFNRYNRRKLVVGDPVVAQLTINGTFRINDVDSFTRLVREVFSLNVKSTDGSITISK